MRGAIPQKNALARFAVPPPKRSERSDLSRLDAKCRPSHRRANPDARRKTAVTFRERGKISIAAEIDMYGMICRDVVEYEFVVAVIVMRYLRHDVYAIERDADRLIAVHYPCDV